MPTSAAFAGTAWLQGPVYFTDHGGPGHWSQRQRIVAFRLHRQRRQDHIKPDMAVITADGIVGKVLRVYRSTSQVLLINDQTSGVGALLDKTRLQGICVARPPAKQCLKKL